MKRYVFALIKKDGKFLLLKRPKDKKHYAGYWNFAGGKIENGESESDCVIREVREETSLSFTPLAKKLQFKDNHGEEKEVIVYLGLVTGELKLNEEHETFGWFSALEIKGLKTLPYIKTMMVNEVEYD